MRKIQVLILFSLMSWVASAQDIHFSQFYMAPLDLNPALTGVMNCNQRLSANYRQIVRLRLIACYCQVKSEHLCRH